MVAGDLIRRSYRTTRSEVEVNQVSNARDLETSKSLTCNKYDAVTVAGSKKLKENTEAKGQFQQIRLMSILSDKKLIAILNISA